MSKADEIAKLFELKKNGVLSDAEFEREKKLVLEGTTAGAPTPPPPSASPSGSVVQQATNFARHELVQVSCPKCKGDFEFLPATQTLKCSYCGHEIQVESSSSAQSSIPDLIIPFSKTKAEATKQFYAKLADDDLVPDDIFDDRTAIKVSAMYCPAYYCTGKYEGNWSALSIVKYTVKRGDKSHTEEQATPISGVVKDSFWHIQMASRLCKKIETSATAGDFRNRLKPFQDAFIQGYQVESFAKARSQDECESELRLLANTLATLKAKEMIPTTEARNFAVNVDINCQLTACLVPTWLCEINHDRNTYHLWLSGHSSDNEIVGDPPRDMSRDGIVKKLNAAGKTLYGVGSFVCCGGAIFLVYYFNDSLSESWLGVEKAWWIFILPPLCAIPFWIKGLLNQRAGEKQRQALLEKSKAKRRSRIPVVE